MNNSNSSIRNSAKAIIVRDSCVLLIRIGDQGGEWYVLPGGGQHAGEPLRETVQRECLEEIGVPVQVGQLRLVREYIAKNHGADECTAPAHRVEFMFECQINADAVPSNGLKADTCQTGIVWVPVADLAAYDLYPTGLVQILRDGVSKVGCAYMGDMV